MQLAQRRIEQGRADEAAKCLSEMKQVLARGVQTIDRLRDYGRQSPEPRPEEAVDLAQVAREASEIARPRIAARGTPIRYRFEEQGLALVRGRRARSSAPWST
jgi:C4-dicarboxylate-specific signal transduction histidine kinase